MNVRTAIAALIVAGAVLTPIGADAAHDGCIVTGEVQGLDTQRTCTYTASSESQSVYVGTPYEWRVWVLRYDDQQQPVDVTLAAGFGPAGAPASVSPEIGETVHVTMWFGCTPPYCGTIGFVAAGLEQGHL